MYAEPSSLHAPRQWFCPVVHEQVAIAEAGGIPALVSLARSGTEMQKQYAARALGALTKLADNDANRVCAYALA